MRTRILLLAGLALALVGCGGGGGDEEALARLEGVWFGPTPSNSLLLEIDGSGDIRRVVEGGVDLGQTGTLQAVGGGTYEGTLSGGTAIRLVLHPAGRHAAFFGEFQVACLELGATSLPPSGFAVGDVAPDAWSGLNLVLDGALRPAQTFDADVTIGAGGTYSGSDASGLVFASPLGTALAPVSGVLRGPYVDNLNPTTGFIEVLPSPDLSVIVAVAFPEFNTTLLNAQFLGLWTRE